MADIFVSYARADKARVAPLVAALEAQGWSVWWDSQITPGQEFDSQISAALDAAKAVVVVWTPTSVDSRWVRGEAREAADRGVLAPVRFEGARLPIDARALHTTDLDDWREDVRSRPFEDLLRALRPLIGGKFTVAESTPGRPGVSICVLPFANMSNDADQEYFADGVSEDIITDLSKVSALFVIARNTAFTFKGRSVEVPQVARQLGVTHVLEGSVRRAGNRVRITAQLIDGASGGHTWAERWDRDLDDIFALQDEISQAIVGALKLKLLPDEKKSITDRGTANLEAYDLYLRARALANGAVTAADFRLAINAFREVLQIDPDFAAVRVDLSAALLWYVGVATHDRLKVFAELQTLGQEAQAQAPDHWSSLFIEALLRSLRHDWLGAEIAYEMVQKTAPPAFSIGRERFVLTLVAMGRLQEASQLVEAARDADPMSWQVSFLAQEAMYVEGRTNEARREYERAATLPGLREPRENSLLQLIWDAGDMERTKLQFRRYLDIQSVPFPALAKVLDLIGQPSAALGVIREAVDDPANQDVTRMMFLPWYAARFGDDELAVKAMRRWLIDLGGYYLLPLWYPCLRRTRQTPAFKQMARDLGLYEYWRSSGNWGDFARPVGDDDFEFIA